MITKDCQRCKKAISLAEFMCCSSGDYIKGENSCGICWDCGVEDAEEEDV